jgi:hypothetical protein
MEVSVQFQAIVALSSEGKREEEPQHLFNRWLKGHRTIRDVLEKSKISYLC